MPPADQRFVLFLKSYHLYRNALSFFFNLNQLPCRGKVDKLGGEKNGTSIIGML